jgi:hypothetical protein
MLLSAAATRVSITASSGPCGAESAACPTDTVGVPPVSESVGGGWVSRDRSTVSATGTGRGEESTGCGACRVAGSATTGDDGEADRAAPVAEDAAVEDATGIGAGRAAAGIPVRVTGSAGDAGSPVAAAVPGGAGRTTAEVAARLRAHGVEAGARTAVEAPACTPERSRFPTGTACSGDTVTAEEATTARPGAEIASAEAMAAFSSPVTREASVISVSSVVTKARSPSVSTFGVSLNDIPACRHRSRAGLWVSSASIHDMTHTDMQPV